jgi:GNAT superfamily N-acetyltransferase
MFEIRTADFQGVQLLLDWAAAEGWNPGLDDASPFYAADPSGYLVGCDNGIPIAGISVVTSGDHFGFLGLYIVHPSYRGRGFGWKIWQAGVVQLGQRTIGLDGVVAQQSNYARSGFGYAHRSMRFAGKAKAAPRPNKGARAITTSDVPKLIEFDARHYGAARPLFLQSWLNGSGGRRGFVFERDGTIVGYGVIRPCINGYKIGPLFADAPDIAEGLLLAMLEQNANALVMIDVPEPNRQARLMVEALGLASVFETARMYRGSAPALPLQNIFGLTSFELG